jgi:hypothetical protein
MEGDLEKEETMWHRLKMLIPGGKALRRTALMAGFAGVIALAFLTGRQGWLGGQAHANPPGDPFVADLPVATPAGSSDYSRRIVAYIYNNIPITREDLGEYLIGRLGAERIDYLVNHRIIEHACQLHHVQVTDAEIEAQLRQDVQAMNITLADFESKVLKRFNKTLFEYREDYLRPKLAMAKFCRDRVVVTQQDLKNAFEAMYGEKVKCRMIVFNENQHKESLSTFEKVRNDDKAFDEAARAQFIPALAASKGDLPPIHKHFGDEVLEKEAFSLKPGEVSAVIQLKDKTYVILKCVEHQPADTTKRMEAVQQDLYKLIFDKKLAEQIPVVFQELRKEANPVVFLRKQITEEDLIRRMPQLMGAPATPPTASSRPETPGTPPPVVSNPAVETMPAIPVGSGPRPGAPHGN